MYSAVCLVQAVIRWFDIVSKHVRNGSGLLLDKSVWFLTLDELMNARWLIEAISEGPPWYRDLRQSRSYINIYTLFYTSCWQLSYTVMFSMTSEEVWKILLWIYCKLRLSRLYRISEMDLSSCPLVMTELFTYTNGILNITWRLTILHSCEHTVCLSEVHLYILSNKKHVHNVDIKQSWEPI